MNRTTEGMSPAQIGVLMLLAIVLACDPSKVPTEASASAEADYSAALVAGLAPHNPTSGGLPVLCLTNANRNGTAFPFANGKGCELNTEDHDGNFLNQYAALIATTNALALKPLTSITRLDYMYAGSVTTPLPPGSVFPDGSRPILALPVNESGDSSFSAYASVDPKTCSDGDLAVGQVHVVGNAACVVTYKTVAYPTWAAFVAAFPRGLIATTAGARPQITLTIPAHYLVYTVTLK